MIHSKHISTTVIAASALAAAIPGNASAHHIIGHSAVAAVEQDVRDAAAEAERQVSSVRSAIENTGANTRRHLVETVETQVQSAERVISRTRSSAKSQVESAKSQVESAKSQVEQRAQPVVSYGRKRVAQVRTQGEERAERTYAAGRSRAERTQAAGERRVARTRDYAENQYAIAKRRAEVLAYRITHEVDAVLASGSFGASTSAGEFSFGWTRAGGCWTGRLSTPVQPPHSRFKRRTGKTVEPVPGQRSRVDASNGDVTLSTGC